MFNAKFNEPGNDGTKSNELPLCSLSVHSGFDYFFDHSHYINPNRPSEIQSRSSRVNSVLGSFCGVGSKAVYEETYDAAVLSYFEDIRDGGISEGSPLASRSMKVALNNLEREKGEDYTNYVAGLLNDRKQINDFWGNQNHEMKTVDDYSTIGGLIDFDKIIGLINDKKINIESILIKGAELVVDLMEYIDGDKPNMSEEKATELMRMSESFVAPLLEIMGYDGFAMNLNSITKRFRLSKLGSIGTKSIEIAESILCNYDDQVFSKSNSDLLDICFDKNTTNELVFNREAKIAMDHGICENDDYEKTSYFVIRRKTRGSLAWKIYNEIINHIDNNPEFDINNPDDLEQIIPMDIIAMQDIFDKCDTSDSSSVDGQIQGLARSFSSVLQRIASSDKTALRPSPGRTDAVHIRGTSEFIETVSGRLSMDGYNGGHDPKEELPGGMEVAKLTFDYNVSDGKPPVKYEIQFITEQQAKEMRTGAIAHIFFKLGIKNPTPEQIAGVRQIHAKKDSVRFPTLADGGAAAERYRATLNLVPLPEERIAVLAIRSQQK